jgi:D-serine deaminase-like pyridoxal phosphate-dependent protein
VTSAASRGPCGLDVTRPTLLLDKSRVLRNIERMAAKAAAAGVKLRPHCKTHQSAEISQWLREYEVDSLTVSSVDMACYFADNGWKDITIAFPVNVREAARLRALAARISLGVLADSDAAISVLGGALDVPVRVWVEVDTGYGRTGIPHDQHGRIVSLVRRIRGNPVLEFAGILTHSGQTYSPTDDCAIRRVHITSIAKMQSVKGALVSAGVPGCRISIGDTPGCSQCEYFEGVDEIRPGNFVFYDLMQVRLESCEPEDIAVAVACPVVGKYQERGQIVVHGGAVHLSMASLRVRTHGTVFGFLSSGGDNDLGRFDKGSPVVSLSQEHGVVRMPERRLRSTSIGDVVLIFPVHSCLTCNLHPYYTTLDGERILRMPR